GVLQAVDEALAEAGVDPAEVAYVAAGSTIALNTIIERSGSKAGLVVTRGFRDVLEIRRTRLPDAPSFEAARPVALVRRALVAEVDERLDAGGAVLRPLDHRALQGEVERLVDSGIVALAISFLHSYRNPAHERTARDLVAERWPNLFVCTSSAIWPERREYERTLVTVMNAYVGPRMRAYYADLQSRLRERGLACPILVTQSNGAMLSIDEAASTPVRTVLSGPAVGVTGAARLGAQAGTPRTFTLDMGGTSADMSVVDGSPRLGTESLIGDFPLFMPAVSIDTIGAGGGSIAAIDEHGVLKVGPRSAGAVPGPACYDLGGTEPTVTDAYLLTGILGEHDLLGGAMRLSRVRAEAAVAGLAQRLGMSMAAAAEAVLRVATANMYAELLPLIARHGVDHREFVLMAYGGAGPVHAFLLASEVGISAVIVPPAPGAMCALGGALTDLAMDFVRSGRWELSATAAIEGVFARLEEDARRWLAEQGLAADEAVYERSADMRYVGQSYELTVDLGNGLAAEEFHRRYEQVYSYRDQAGGVEVLHLRLLARVPTRRPAAAGRDAVGSGALAPVGMRLVTHCGTERPVPVYRRADLPTGWRTDGPVIITQYDTTTFVTPGFDLTVDRHGNLRGAARP
ncbi:MAG: hydantoinase/oxoprolinase family protein, partial [Nitriliruptorales bacterium]|nr:hydantoinase/oxoprolinase family protein [Nitriliruptorales bacterium]